MPYKNPEDKKIHDAAYYSANKEKRKAEMRAYTREWNKKPETKEYKRAYDRAWGTSPEGRAYKKAYRDAWEKANR